jgi:hypothetical protein
VTSKSNLQHSLPVTFATAYGLLPTFNVTSMDDEQYEQWIKIKAELNAFDVWLSVVPGTSTVDAMFRQPIPTVPSLPFEVVHTVYSGRLYYSSMNFPLLLHAVLITIGPYALYTPSDT